jgi:hypothetical protein
MAAAFPDLPRASGRERTMKIVPPVPPTRKRGKYARVQPFHHWNGAAQPFSGGQDD